MIRSAPVAVRSGRPTNAPPVAAAVPAVPGTGLEKVALYIRVGHSLRNRIAQGEWAANTQLPPIGELAREYGVALVTVRLAIQQLASEGLLVSTRGRGTFVCGHVKPIAQDVTLRAAINDRLSMPVDCSIRVLQRSVTSALPAHFVPEGAAQYPEYAIVEKLHLQDEDPFSHVTVLVARQLYDRFPPGADEQSKILKLILDLGRLKLARSHVEITLSYADDAMATLLRCAPLSALVRIRTSRIDTKGKVVLCHDAYYRGDKFIYQATEENVELGKSTGLVLPAALSARRR